VIGARPGSYWAARVALPPVELTVCGSGVDVLAEPNVNVPVASAVHRGAV
jgi:hypothetical protein